MKLDFTSLMNLLFPPSDDEKLISSLTPEQFALKLEVATTGFITSLSSFKDPEIRAAIHLNKFHGHPQAADHLAALLSRYIAHLPQRQYTIVPIPLSKERKRERGYNQVTKVAKKARNSLRNFEIDDSILARVRDTKPQTSLSKQERIENLKNAFVVPQRFVHTISTMHIVILDDVSTTGSTLKEAHAALSACAPLSLSCVALAR